MKNASGDPFDPSQSAQPTDKGGETSLTQPTIDPVLALFAKWKVVNAKATERTRRGMAAEQAFVDLYGGNTVAVISNKSLETAYKAHMEEALGPDPGWDLFEEHLLKQLAATPATTNEGIAAKIEVALVYSEFDPDSSVDHLDLPWSFFLLAIKELKSGGTR